MTRSNLHRVLAALILAGVLGSSPARARQDSPPLMTDLVVLGVDAVWFGDVAWGDFSGDGWYDLAVTGNRGTYEQPEPFTQLFVFEEDTFVERPDPAGGETPIQVPAIRFAPGTNIGTTPLQQRWQSALAWQDVDGDGHLDLAVTGMDGNGGVGLDLYTWVGDQGTPTLWHVATVQGVRLGDVAWGDFSGDGVPDLAAAGLGPDGDPVTLLYEVMLEDGAVVALVERPHAAEGLAYGALDWGDFDGDGDLDLAITGVAEPQATRTLVYRNDGGSIFTQVAELRGMLFADLRWLDFDDDADLDLVVSGGKLGPFLIQGTLMLYANDGGTFVDVSDGLLGAFENDPVYGRYQGALELGDMDNDGSGDFITFGIRTPITPDVGRVYRRQSPRVFWKDFKEKLAGGYLGGADAGDYDGDGDLDLVGVGDEIGVGRRVRLYRNGAPRPDLGVWGRNNPPLPPNGLSSTVVGDRVTFSWEPAFDAQTAPEALGYHVRVGTAPGEDDVIAAQADPATGRRLFPGPGNVGRGSSLSVRAFPPGTYYWSVQAIDAGWAGSPFAAEQVLVVPAG